MLLEKDAHRQDSVCKTGCGKKGKGKKATIGKKGASEKQI
jgi:hypothetical protein